MGYGVASAKFAGAIYISIAARVPKLFRDSSRPQKGTRISFPNTLEPEKASSSSLNDLVLIRGLFAEALRVHIKWIRFRNRALTLMGHNPVLILQKQTVILLFFLLTTSADSFAF
jgi:hypothetical protein